jgi:hypothetical protein
MTSEDKKTKNILIRDVSQWIVDALDTEVKELKEKEAIYRGVSRVDLARKILEDHAKAYLKRKG